MTMNITSGCHTPQKNFVHFGHSVTFSLVPALLQISNVNNGQVALNFTLGIQGLYLI